MSEHVSAEWVREQIAELRRLADDGSTPGVAAGIDTAAVVLEARLAAELNYGGVVQQ